MLKYRVRLMFLGLFCVAARTVTASTSAFAMELCFSMVEKAAKNLHLTITCELID